MDRDPATFRTLLGFNRQVLARTLDGIPGAVFDEPMVEFANTPRWVLLHLCTSLDLALRALGRPTLLTPAFVTEYGPGSSGRVVSPPPLDDTRATLDALFDAIDGALAELETDAAALERVRARLARTHRAPLLTGTPITTMDQVAAHLVTTHLAMHIGQLSLVRRRCGLPGTM